MVERENLDILSTCQNFLIPVCQPFYAQFTIRLFANDFLTNIFFFLNLLRIYKFQLKYNPTTDFRNPSPLNSYSFLRFINADKNLELNLGTSYIDVFKNISSKDSCKLKIDLQVQWYVTLLTSTTTHPILTLVESMFLQKNNGNVFEREKKNRNRATLIIVMTTKFHVKNAKQKTRVLRCFSFVYIFLNISKVNSIDIM